MQKIILPSVLVVSFLILGVSSFQEAQAVPDCFGADSGVLEARELYIGTQNARLVKIDTLADPPEACEVGQMREFADGMPPTGAVVCEDMALNPVDQKLYCIAFGNQLHRVDRTADFNLDGTAAATGEGVVVDTERIGTFIRIGTSTQSFVNAFEIDLYGTAYIAAREPKSGQFYTLDLTTAVATLRTDFNLPFVGLDMGTTINSSGDLVRDESTGFDMYWTIKCDGLNGGMNDVDEACATSTNDILYKINLDQGPKINPGEQDSLTRIAELPEGQVFAMEMIQPNFDLCFLTTNSTSTQGVLFETDRNGVVTRTSVAITPDVNSFGAAGNPVGGMLVMINVMSLAVAAAQTNPAWLLLFAISGAAVVAYQFKGKTKTRKNINT